MQSVMMSVKILDLAVAANTVYNFYKGRGNDKAASEKAGALSRMPTDFAVVHAMESIDDGFFGAVYRSEKSKQYIVAYRGTAVDDGKSGQMVGKSNLKTDVGLYAIERLPTGIRFAKLLLEQAQVLFGGGQPILCGHSLGGAIATIVAVETGFPCCAFNAPTVSKMVRGGIIHGPYVRVHSSGMDRVESNILNFNMKWDPVSKSSQAVGKVIQVSGAPLLKAHSMDVMIDVLKKSSYGRQNFDDALRTAPAPKGR